MNEVISRAEDTAGNLPGEAVSTRLKEAARALAGKHEWLYQAKDGPTLVADLDSVESILKTAAAYFRTAEITEFSLTVAAEWLLDNEYIVQRAIRQVREDLPLHFYNELPRFGGQAEKNGWPRVFDLARTLVRHEQAHLIPARLETFIGAYQQVHPLKMGEVWAFPPMLRLVILFTLCGAAARVTGKTAEGSLPLLTFPGEAIAEDRLIANCIGSLRLLGTQDWNAFFERASLVERILNEEPVEIYPRMDFESRDRCRKQVEQIAAQTGRTEWDVARFVVHRAQDALARANTGKQPFSLDESPDGASHGNSTARETHVGYYLLDRGLEEVEQALGARFPFRQRLLRGIYRYPARFYFTSIIMMIAAGLAVIAGYGYRSGGSWISLLFVVALSAVPLSAFVVNLVNGLVTRFVPPRVLPKMDFSEEIPDDCATMIVIPALLTGAEAIDDLLAQLKLHYLRNPEANLFFALLTDYVDSRSQSEPEDAARLDRAAQGIEALNTWSSTGGAAPFFLLHRPRRWNAVEGIWMGWERKRGKLQELNRLILGGAASGFERIIGDVDRLSAIRYVITLDADTILPLRSAHRLIAALAHPLNRAEFDPLTNRVTAGYTILQPRTDIMPGRGRRSLFTRIFSRDSGLDLYTLAVSDVYQDLFGEGIYVGKGIYDVAAFERTLRNRIPENRLLSHDLFEGLHGRTALVTDIVLLEDYPDQYLAEMERTHRWIRGDWQLLPWLFANVPAPGGTRVPGRLKPIDRWKIADNLRRSLLAPALLIFFVAGWVSFPGSPLAWTAMGMFVLSFPTLMSLTSGIGQRLAGDSANKAFLSARQSGLRWFFALVFLPFEAMIHLDAILTTLIRLFFENRGFLQWVTAEQASRRWVAENRLARTWRHMIAVFLLSAGLIVALALTDRSVLWIACPILFLWMFSPQVAYLINRPIRLHAETLTPEQRDEFGSIARLTWLFFEEFIRPEDHWLPPDHFQEFPRGGVAHRTSPTNIGLGLLSALAAHDFGYLETIDLVARVRAAFETMDRLKRFRGHFINWYDTRTLTPLVPRYVSTVDSGNLAACLVALGQGCLDLAGQPIFRPQSWTGLGDLLRAIRDLIGGWNEEMQIDRIEQLQDYLDGFDRFLRMESDRPGGWVRLLEQASGAAAPDSGVPVYSLNELDRRLIDLLEEIASERRATDLHRLRIYTNRLHLQLEGVIRQAGVLAPWLAHAAQLPDLLAGAGQDRPEIPAWTRLLETLRAAVRLVDISNLPVTAAGPFEELEVELERNQAPALRIEEARDWLEKLRSDLQTAAGCADSLLADLQELAGRCELTAREMDFRFLFDPRRKVFHLGYNLELDRLDENYYDLLASEACIASVFAIAKGDVPQSHWLHLSRPVTRVDGELALISWSATMFEYLMPPLLLRRYEGTLLDQSARVAVGHQIRHGVQHGIPWGLSESGFFRFDAHLNYQYRAFGVPGLGFKRGLEEDLVIAPYASFLSLPYRAAAVFENYRHLKKLGMLGLFGFYEAVDFTERRMPPGESSAIVRSFMAHHQGMLLVALANHLHGNSIVERFHSNPLIQSVEHLLQEQVPVDAPLEDTRPERIRKLPDVKPAVRSRPWTVAVRTAQPRPHLLSNGRYSVLITNGGGGFSRWRDLDLTRWRPDSTLDCWGTWIYVKDLDHPEAEPWSATDRPTIRVPQSSQAEYHAHKAVFRRRDGDISLSTEITVPPGDVLEIRRVSVTNHSENPRRLRLASYAEIVLAPRVSDERHPAFNTLFIQSEFHPQTGALFYRRRKRSADEDPVHLAHAILLEEGSPSGLAYESERGNFLGRGQDVRRPQALLSADHGLTGTSGAVLDPIASLSCVVELRPHETIRLAFLTCAGASTKALHGLLERYRDWYAVERAFDQALSYAELELRRLGTDGEDLPYFQRLLSALVFPQRTLRPEAGRLAANVRGQSVLWKFGISGDYPILLVFISETDDLQLVSRLVNAHAFWSGRQFKVDLVILNEKGTSYGQELRDRLNRILALQKSEDRLHSRGGIFILYADQLDENERTLLFAAAGAVIDASRGSLAEQLQVMENRPSRLPAFTPGLERHDGGLSTPEVGRPGALLFDNGLGGGSPDGREYAIFLEDGRMTPRPWANVIANEQFGFLVTESGSSFTWAGNSGENRLTPWSNDPVTDPSGETLYLRDEETAEVWTPTPLPIRLAQPYLVRHGAGYTVFEHNSHGLKHRLQLFAAPDDPVKIVRLRLENVWDRPRRITATCFVEWVLGTRRSETQRFIIPEYDADHQALLARNPYNEDFAGRVAFLAANKQVFGLTADRTEFLGRSGSHHKPAALLRVGLTGAVEIGGDPCAALQLHLDLPAGGSEEIYFLLGQGDSRKQTDALIRKYRDPAEVDRCWEAVHALWDRLLGEVAVETPDPAMDFMMNRWLLYQTIACRIWGRSAFYQSSGAFGYRDQLQDVMALFDSAPEIARAHLLRAAGQQFEAGDVLHWWHPPAGRGVRTRISDDLVWLPYVTAAYIERTGDLSVLEEMVPFREGPLLTQDQEEAYGLFPAGGEAHTLLEHCRRALSKGLTTGPHRLPLIGTGDWNDGMNRVGAEGRGESVWLGWFLNVTLERFAALCERIGGTGEAGVYREQAAELVRALEANAWDGDWYLRAFYDDGSPLGSKGNRECRIDSIAQSWAVLSAAGDPERARRAMQSVLEQLVRREEGLVLLFTPPFDRTPKDPGYIRGYLPGIRENGGQYTHAAIWSAWAFAELKEGDLAGELFSLLNPIRHADDVDKMRRYEVEPYVVAADIYGAPPHVGKGGWTWYSGSGGWLYRFGLEAILGLRRKGAVLEIDPCIPSNWPGFRIQYRYENSLYRIEVRNPNRVCCGVIRTTLDRAELPRPEIPLAADGGDHEVVVELGAGSPN